MGPPRAATHRAILSFAQLLLVMGRAATSDKINAAKKINMRLHTRASSATPAK
jgi:hypothetical protein